MSEALGHALAQAWIAERRANEQMRRDYPIGSLVHWDGKHRGSVIDHGYDTRIKVKNVVSDKEYWIHAYRISS